MKVFILLWINRNNKLLSLVPIITEEAAKLELEIQPTKSQLIYFNDEEDPIPHEIRAGFADLRIPILTESATILGCPIAKNNLVLSHALEKSVNSIIQSIQHCMSDKTVSNQTALLILRPSFAHKIEYLMRCLGSAPFNEMEKKFHEHLLNWVIEKTGVDPLCESHDLS
jgi:hypothetical protein